MDAERSIGRGATSISGPLCPQLRRAVAAPDQPARALPLRLLPAPLRAGLGVPQLRRALHDRAHVLHGDRQVQQLRRQHAAADMSRDRARAAERRARRALDPLGRFRAAARAGRGGARRRRARDPRRRDGRPLRAADHASVRWSSPRCASRSRTPAAMLDVHLMIERPERQVEPSSCRPAPTRSPSTPRPPRTPRYTADLIRERGAASGVAINPATPVEALGEIAGADRPGAVHDRQPRLGRAAVHRALAGQDRRACARCSATGWRWRSTAASIPAPRPSAARRGRALFVAGSAIFGAADPGAAYLAIARAVDAA